MATWESYAIPAAAALTGSCLTALVAWMPQRQRLRDAVAESTKLLLDRLTSETQEAQRRIDALEELLRECQLERRYYAQQVRALRLSLAALGVGPLPDDDEH